MGDPDKHLTFLENFISKYYARQHPAIRAITFLLFAFLLASAIYHIVGGDYVVSGRVLYSTPGAPKEPARNYDVRLGERFFGTNSKGIYHVILSPLEYAALVTAGKMKLEVLKGDAVMRDETDVAFRRGAQMFTDIVTTAPTQAQQTSRVQPLPNVPFAAWAIESGSGRRLILYCVLLGGGLTNSNAASFFFDMGGRQATLLATRTGGTPAGAIPVSAGEWLRFGGDYYFDLPPNAQLRGARVNMVFEGESVFRKMAQSVGLANIVESFPFEVEPPEGQIARIRGTRGSQLQVVLARRYQVVLFGKGDLGAGEDRLKEKLVRTGFLVQSRLAPLGYGQTNSLFAGRLVPFTAVQMILRAASQEGIAFKSVQYHLNLRSGNPYEIQLGQTIACNGAPPIGGDQLQNLLDASNEDEFTERVRAFQDCEAAPQQAIRRRR